MLSPRLQHNAVLRNMYWGEVLAREQRPHIFAQTEIGSVDRSTTPRDHDGDMWRSTYQGDFCSFRRRENFAGTRSRFEATLASRRDGSKDLCKTLIADFRTPRSSSQQSRRSNSARGASRPQTTDDSRVLRTAGRTGMFAGTARDGMSNSLMLTRTRVPEHVRPPAGA
mmetsp:Transcript_48130/g.112553  ORF Transcript_48130/g.112553 Transcript_48130/m.112553 type:complete len:168 (-) Transcript_48130:29-532(-)